MFAIMPEKNMTSTRYNFNSKLTEDSSKLTHSLDIGFPSNKQVFITPIYNLVRRAKPILQGGSRSQREIPDVENHSFAEDAFTCNESSIWLG